MLNGTAQEVPEGYVNVKLLSLTLCGNGDDATVTASAGNSEAKRPTLVCEAPVFTEEQKLLARIDGSPVTTNWIAQAINYLRAKYCVVIAFRPEAISSEGIGGGGCSQDGGYYLGEKVYWGECHE